MNSKNRDLKQKSDKQSVLDSPRMKRRHFLGFSGAATATILIGPAFLTRALASPAKAMKGKGPASRYSFFKSIIIAVAFLLYGNFGSLGFERKKPNIVLILIDDMGWKDVGYAGSEYYETPNIDRLASEGMQFTNGYSAAPTSTPSRGAIFSGKNPGRTKLTTVFAGKAGPDDRLYDRSKYRGGRDQYFEARHRHALPDEEIILAQALLEGGYKTGFFGKWHIGECPNYYPDDRGFEVAKGYRRQHGMKYGHWGEVWPKGNFANLPDPAPRDFIPDILTDECITFMKNHYDQPFFAVLSHYIVHTPITPRPVKIPKYRKREKTDQNDPEYAALVESVDESVGRVLQTINELELDGNTMVIFTSDNGGLTFPGKTSNYPLMGGKSFPFEAGMKVPFIIKWPGKIDSGVSKERVVGTDLYPTILSAASLNLRPDQHVDGKNLMPLLTEKKGLPDRPIVFHFPHYTHATGPFSSIILNDWKLIHFYNDEEGAYLLYDLSEDPDEQNDLSETKQEKRKALAKQLDSELKGMKAEMPLKNPNFSILDSYYSGRRLKNLRFTKELAEEERDLFESRLKN